MERGEALGEAGGGTVRLGVGGRGDSREQACGNQDRKPPAHRAGRCLRYAGLPQAPAHRVLLLMTVLTLTHDPDRRHLWNSAVTAESWRSSTKWDN